MKMPPEAYPALDGLSAAQLAEIEAATREAYMVNLTAVDEAVTALGRLRLQGQSIRQYRTRVLAMKALVERREARQ